MKALSVKQPWANLIASGEKTIETRTWWTRYRGELLIVSSKEPQIPPFGCAVAIATLIDCRRMTAADERAAGCAVYPGAMAWVLDNIIPLASVFRVRGKPGLYDVTLPDQVHVIARGTRQYYYTCRMCGKVGAWSPEWRFERNPILPECPESVLGYFCGPGCWGKWESGGRYDFMMREKLIPTE